ncbi:MAG: hypothetical protein N2314_08740 [Brevinematales bacterium]|nr:hypothetical protein [Brevinematales bacterium]
MKSVSYSFWCVLVSLVVACSSPQPTKTPGKESVMYPINEPFTVTSTEVRQGEKYAIAKSPSEIRISYFASNTVWKLSSSLSHLPSFEAPESPLLVALYNMALEEALLDIRPDKTFMAGEKWNGVWTRDISYSIHLALAILFPEISSNSLFAKVDAKRKFIIQDTGTGGSWPISSDRVVWSLAAKEYLLWHADKTFLSRAYEVMKNTALADRHAAYNPTTGLYYGESSFMDWREQSYASWMSPADIYLSSSFSTCVLHYHHLSTLAWMAKQLNFPQEAKQWEEWAQSLKKAIRTHFANQTLGTYSGYIYPFPISQTALKTDNLGLALAVLTTVVEPSEAPSVVQNIPVVPFGVVCLWPQQPHTGYYHNKGIWPFVNAYYVLAAKEAKNLEAVDFGIKAMTRAAAFFGTHKENFSYDRGHTDKMAVNSDRQLWSVAGYLALVYKVLFGISVDDNGVFFQPMVPDFIRGPLTLKDFPFRQSRLTIIVKGQGDTIETMRINGNPVSPSLRLRGDTPETYLIEISLKRTSPKQSLRLVSPDDIALAEPKIKISNNTLSWSPIKQAVSYTVLLNQKPLATTTETSFLLPSPHGVFTVIANHSNAVLSSCVGKPLWLLSPTIQQEIEDIPSLTSLATNRYKGFKGTGYVLLDNEGTITPTFEITIPKTGAYLVRFRYANGNGPINTDNRCGIRTLLIDKQERGVIVFPQRGTWTEWGYSSSLLLSLTKGKHTVSLVKTAFDDNMNGNINQAALDSVEFILWE